MLLILPIVLLAAEPSGAITLEQAMAAAEEATRDVIRAEADLLLVDVDRARALAAILPSLNLFVTANETFFESPIFEARYGVYKTPGCVVTAQDNCAGTIEPGAALDLEYKGFYDAKADSVSQPQFQAGLSARQLIFDGGRWWTLLARSSDLRELQSNSLESIKSGARINAVRRFYDLVKAKESVKVAELEVQLSEAQVRRARSLIQTGEGQTDGLATAERNLASDRVSLARRSFVAANSGRSLNLAMGRPPETPVAIQVPQQVLSATIALASPVLPGRDALIGLALERRSEIKSARALIHVVERNIELREADHWPTLALNASWTRLASRRPDRIFGDPFHNFIGTIGLDLRWTVFSGGAINASVEEQEMELKKADANYDEVERGVKNEVLQRADELVLLIDVHRLQVDGARSAQRARELVESGYREGKSTALELRDAEQRLTQAMLEAMVGRIDIEVAAAELKRSIGAELDATLAVLR